VRLILINKQVAQTGKLHRLEIKESIANKLIQIKLLITLLECSLIYLIKKDADINAKNTSGKTTLDIAGDVRIRKYLIKHSAKSGTDE